MVMGAESAQPPCWLDTWSNDLVAAVNDDSYLY